MAKVLTSIGLLLLATGAFGMFDAHSWLQMHSTTSRQPDMSDLKELQDSNPEAYALVKALLVKQSLGLIRKKEPTEDAGSEYADTSSSGAGDSAPQTHSTKSFWAWKPPDDGAAVQSVMSQVAGSLSAVKSKQGRTIEPDDAEPVRAADPAPEAPEPAAPVSAPEEDPLTMKDGPITPESTPQDTGAAADIFSKGASEAKNAATSETTKTSAAAAGGSFWSGLFGSKPKPEPAAKPAPKKMAAVSQSTQPGFLKNFDWNSDDGDDDSTNSKSSSGSLSSGNSYAHFLN